MALIHASLAAGLNSPIIGHGDVVERSVGVAGPLEPVSTSSVSAKRRSACRRSPWCRRQQQRRLRPGDETIDEAGDNFSADGHAGIVDAVNRTGQVKVRCRCSRRSLEVDDWHLR